jgi:dihydroorotase
MVSETLPLASLLATGSLSGSNNLVLMNLSTAAGVDLLEQQRSRPRDGDPLPMASVGWWHLVTDSGQLDPAAEGWRLVPSLGSPRDREALIAGLASGVITAVAVHHSPLDAEEQLLPLDQRRPGVAGHGAPRGLVLPQLWQELVARRGWTPAQLWQVLCWGGSQLLGETPERLEIGSDVSNHAAYLAEWIQLLRQSPTLLYKLLSEARQAADWISPPQHPAEASPEEARG